MTIMGAALLDTEHAIAWIDAEHWKNGAVSGYWDKLSVNSMLSMIGLGTGPTRILNAADEAVRHAKSFDDCEREIPGALRSATMQHGADCLEGERYLCAEYLLVGMSERAGRMLIWRFSYGRFFVPTLSTIMLTPPVEDKPEIWKPRHAVDLVASAREQMAKLGNPPTARPGRGNLTMAIITPHRIVLDTVRDFARTDDGEHQPMQEAKECSSTAF